jgi:methylmalonyl-CoA mutase cobalamin-binding subunit
MIQKNPQKTVVLGVLGVDAHVVGNKIMGHALEKEGEIHRQDLGKGASEINE